ncbi:hypothetical protein INT45_008528 [Circinella minor]|uniref:Major facilitator superfamily (MFS) profile domain-containing protein n=1 Tax=Circinella minor TaxID=1195481 RepID=A0A8H7SDA7_9FUNG|nr:hypothetical protein INT45_008528 [Circinella minor]
MGSLFLFIFASEFWMFALARALQGFASGGISTIGYVIVADTFPSEALGTKIGIVSMCFMGGLAAGAPVGGTIAVAGIVVLLYLGLVERRNNPDEWFEIYKKNDNLITKNSHGSNNHDNSFHFDTEKHITESNSSNRSICNKHVTEKENKSISSASSIKYSVEQSDRKNQEQEPGTILANTLPFTSPSQLSLSKAQSITSHHHNKSDNEVTMLQLLRSPRVLTTMLVSFCSGWAVIGFEPTLPVYLNIQWGYNSSQIGLLLVTQLIPSAVASIMAGCIYDWIGGKLLCFSALLLDGASVALSGIPNRNTSVVPLIVTTSGNEFFASMYRAATLAEAMYATKALKSRNSSSTDDDDDDNTDCDSAHAYGLANMSFAIA